MLFWVKSRSLPYDPSHGLCSSYGKDEHQSSSLSPRLFLQTKTYFVFHFWSWKDSLTPKVSLREYIARQDPGLMAPLCKVQALLCGESYPSGVQDSLGPHHLCWVSSL